MNAQRKQAKKNTKNQDKRITRTVTDVVPIMHHRNARLMVKTVASAVGKIILQDAASLKKKFEL